MRVILITQNDLLYLPKAIRYLIDIFPTHSTIIGAIVLPASPFGTKESFASKIWKAYRIFGASFFLKYSWRYLVAKLFHRDVRDLIKVNQTPIFEFKGNINGDEALAKIKSLKPDLLVSIAGNQIFKKRLLDIPVKGVINLHSGLLPKYRGLMPAFWALKNGEQNIGVSVFFVDEGIDSGPMLVQKQIPIGTMTYNQLIIETKRLGMDAIIEALDLIESGEYELIPNPDSDKTYFSFPTQRDIREFYACGKRFY